MPKKKKTAKGRREPERRPANRVVLWLVGFLFLVGVSLAAFYFFRAQERPSQVPPAYEEAHIRPSRIQEYIGRIDRIVYEVLYRRGVVEKDILFTDVGRQIDDDDAWDFTEITVRFPDEAGRRLVQSELPSKIAELGPSVECWRDAEPSEGIAFRVYVRGRLTHRICLVIEGERPGPLYVKRLPKVAVIIDDMGYDLVLARAFASLGIPVTLSVLPMAPCTGDIAREAGRNGRELMLHLPMEPKGYPELNPGPGALLNSMEPREIRSLVIRHLNEVPEAGGVNNHMGSAFTEEGEKVEVFLEEIRKRDMFFVDSKTSARSVAYSAARRMGVPAACRSVFLDNEHSAKNIGIQIERLLGVARQRGEAVAIAHPFPETLKALKGEAERLKGEVEIVTVKELAR